jgi:GMP synthase-like glutamine amidotransferase
MNETAMNIAIFELGEIPEELSDRYPDYPKMIAGWLSPSMPEAKFTGISPVRGDKLPRLDAYDGYIYSGSRHGVYDGLNWIEPVKSFIRSVAGFRKPQFGICFGHQIIAEAMGGKAVKSDRGWGVGVHTYGIGQMSTGNTKQVPVMVMHQDQVIALPYTAEVIGGNEFCPIGVARYPESVLTVQFHPEFNMDYMVDLLDLRGGITIPIERTDAARNSLVQTPEDRQIGDWTADFFRVNLDSPVV